ncbi:MAG: hypothetical protein QXX01_01105 [Candidatus Aenigmatarchaeota archaeon]|nr:hypothetical protein [Candidatus Aenigmarchaeota archaeon]
MGKKNKNVEMRIEREIKKSERKIKEEIEREIRYIEIKYGNLILFLLALIVAYIFLEPEYFELIKSFIYEMKEYGIIGIFISGGFYTLSATSPIATIVIYIFGKFYSPFLIALVGATGSVIVDYFIFIYSKKFLKFEIRKIKIRKISTDNIIIKKLSPIIAFFIFASPLPDELASIFLEKMNYDKRKFFLISYISNFFGILFISTCGAYFL